MNFSVIIIGAGAAGLLAARELSAAGLSVLVLEAAAMPGGRIFTLEDKGFSGYVEAGAEFVHGALPITLQLLKEGGISYRPIKGRMVQVQKGEWGKQNMFAGEWDELMEKMQALEEEGPEKDIPIADFLAREFPGEKHAGLRMSVQRFAEGYDLADIGTASTLALHKEWKEEGQEEYRINGGYGRLVHFLVDQCRTMGCQIHYGSPAKEIRWQKGRVEVVTAGGQSFAGGKLLITASLGILQMDASSLAPPSADPSGPSQSATSQPSQVAASSPADPSQLTASSGALSFYPPIPDYQRAVQQMGYGSVIKILIEFREPFWEDKGKGVSFILSDEEVPTWWLQSPENSSLLTGWLTGSAMKRFRTFDKDRRMDLCLQSLASIFGRDIGFMREQLVASYVADWPSAPYIKGGYSFDTVESENARRLLCTPIQQTIYFAGEALYEGPSPGTVEAAFTSGKEAAEKIIAQP